MPRSISPDPLSLPPLSTALLVLALFINPPDLARALMPRRFPPPSLSPLPSSSPPHAIAATSSKTRLFPPRATSGYAAHPRPSRPFAARRSRRSPLLPPPTSRTAARPTSPSSSAGSARSGTDAGLVTAHLRVATAVALELSPALEASDASPSGQRRPCVCLSLRLRPSARLLLSAVAKQHANVE